MTRLLEDGKPTEALVEFAELNGIKARELNAQRISSAMQKQWLKRGKLRYEISGEPPDLENFQLLQQLGCVNVQFPSSSFKGYNGSVLLLGALASRVKDRFAWYLELVRRGYILESAPLYMLGSERPLDPEKENREALLASHPVYPSVMDWKSVEEMPKTEAEMMRMIVGMRAGFPDATVINTLIQPKDDGNFRMPNTADTVATWLREGALGTRCLVISNNPFVEYQALTVWRAIADTTGINVAVEGTGPEANIKLPLATFRDNIAKQLYEELKRQYLLEKR